MKTIGQLIIASCLILTCPKVVAGSFSNSPQKNVIIQKASRGEINLQWLATSKNVLVIASTYGKPSQTAKGINYSANAKFGSGSAVDEGFVVYKGEESSVIVTGLQSGKEYCFSIYEADANGDFIVAGPTLSCLRGIYDLNKAVLRLKTTAEKSNNSFIVERKDNSSNWKEIGKIDLTNSPSESGEYIFVDKGPLNGTYYYRLKQLSGNNNYTYSLPVEVQSWEMANVFEVIEYPELKSKSEFEVFSDIPMELIVTDDKGVRVKTILLTQENYGFRVKDLPEGIYSVSGSNRRGVLTQKVSITK